MINPEVIPHLQEISTLLPFLAITIAHCYPVIQLDKGKWNPFKGEKVGTDGNNGVMITEHKTLIEQKSGTLINPATGDVFRRTKADILTGQKKKYFNKEKGILVNVYMREERD